MLWELIALFIAILISIPLIIVSSQCLVTLLCGRNIELSINQPEHLTASYRILMPAHNEAGIIKKTLTDLIVQLPDHDPKNIILIADNCTDNTAEIAKSLGVTVLERNNISERGKGYALDFGIQYLKKHHPPEIVVVLDADCETSKSALQNLISTALSRNLPAQMIYLMRVRNTSIKQKIAGFAWLLKNEIRLTAMNALGFPVILTGTGMAFPWQVLTIVRTANGSIVEDLQLGIDCTINGFPPVLSPNSVIYSDFPEQSSAELTQRTRWEHGHLQTIFHQVPFLVKQAIMQKNWRLLGLAMDIGVPPLSLLVMLTLAGWMGLLSFSWLAGNTLALNLLSTSFFYFAAMLLAVWWRFGKQYLSAQDLMGIPFYIFSKLSVYFSFVFKRQKDWVRTERDS